MAAHRFSLGGVRLLLIGSVPCCPTSARCSFAVPPQLAPSRDEARGTHTVTAARAASTTATPMWVRILPRRCYVCLPKLEWWAHNGCLLAHFPRKSLATASINHVIRVQPSASLPWALYSTPKVTSDHETGRNCAAFLVQSPVGKGAPGIIVRSCSPSTATRCKLIH
jgi:hypothetical protein